LELRARDQTGGAICALLDLAPRSARRLRDGGEDEEILLTEVKIGDRLRVRPGDAIPVDGAGVLIKSAEALERMEKVDRLVVDKTGTLTEGRPKVTAVVPAPGMVGGDVLRLAASLEKSSEHPLAAAVVEAAREKGIVSEDVTDFKSVTGKGVTGMVAGRPVALGNARLMSELRWEPAPKLQSRVPGRRW
jgi:cation transport ATPase